jgi:P pilus assembly chaperone PapD
MLFAKKRFPAIVSGLFIGALQLLASSTIAVAGSFNITPVVTISEARGGQGKATITVSNSGKMPLRMRVYAENFTYSRQGYLGSENHAFSAIPYLQFSPRELTVPPGVTRNVRVGMTIPPSAPDGEYRAAIFVEELREQEVQTDPSKKNQIVMLARVASVFFVSKGGIKADLNANSFIWNDRKKTLNILLNNQGKKSAYPTINWKISQNGKEVITGNILGVVLQSGTEREVTLRNNENNLNISPGNYQLSGEIVNDGQKSVPFKMGISIP